MKRVTLREFVVFWCMSICKVLCFYPNCNKKNSPINLNRPDLTRHFPTIDWTTYRRNAAGTVDFFSTLNDILNYVKILLNKENYQDSIRNCSLKRHLTWPSLWKTTLGITTLEYSGRKQCYGKNIPVAARSVPPLTLLAPVIPQPATLRPIKPKT